jgi:hypothetical protein
MVQGAPLRLAVVTENARQGNFAVRAIVQQGDDPIGASGNRNELVRTRRYVEGDDIYFAWSTLFPGDFGRTDRWQVFTQWHHDGCCGSPPLELDLHGERVTLTLQKEGVFDATELWSAPLVRGKWLDFVVHVKWSASQSTGFVELWYDGALVLPRRAARTLFSDGRAYMKQGYYRHADIPWTGTVFHDGMVEATTLADVLPPPQPSVADAGAGADAPDPIGDASEITDAGEVPSLPGATPGDPGAPPPRCSVVLGRSRRRGSCPARRAGGPLCRGAAALAPAVHRTQQPLELALGRVERVRQQQAHHVGAREAKSSRLKMSQAVLHSTYQGLGKAKGQLLRALGGKHGDLSLGFSG